jgi:hypothetical protein
MNVLLNTCSNLVRSFTSPNLKMPPPTDTDAMDVDTSPVRTGIFAQCSFVIIQSPDLSDELIVNEVGAGIKVSCTANNSSWWTPSIYMMAQLESIITMRLMDLI